MPVQIMCVCVCVSEPGSIYFPYGAGIDAVLESVGS